MKNKEETIIDKLFSGTREFFRSTPPKIILLRGLLYLALAITVLFTLMYAWVYSTIPSRSSFASLKNYTSSELYSSDGKLMGKYFLQDRKNVPLEKVSPHVVNALIATEDARFYQHNGIDKRGLLRVFFKTLIMGNESSGGGSTITQQLAKNLFPRKNFPFFSLPINKLREAITADKLEDVFNKQEILSFYLNTVPFGENAFGIEVASKRFFSKSAQSLSIQEAATLVGMLKATTTYNPRRNPETSKQRRNVVIAQMVKYEYLPETQKDSLQKLPLVIKYHYVDHNKGPATHFREHLRLELVDWCSKNQKPDGTEYNLYTDGLKIYTSIDLNMQKYAEKAVNKNMKELQKQFFLHWGRQNPWGKDNRVVEDAVKRSARYKQLKNQGLDDQEIKKVFATPVKRKIFTWGGSSVREISPLDSIKHYLKYLHAGFIVIEPGTGYVKAWVGGLDHEYFKYDHVNQNSKRQVGSTFKPIVYAAALEEGIPPCDYITNEKISYPDFDNWSPGNSDGKYGGSYSLEGALTNSVNTVSAQVIMKAGIDNVISLAERMGIESPLDPVPSLALGTADVSLLEMVGAYSVFPNNGYYTAPSYITKIVAADGTVLADFTKERKKSLAMSPQNASIMIKMMESVVNKGTASRLRYHYGLKVPIGGKTGTTQSQADGWFIGYTPDLVAGVWVGAEDRRVHFRSLELGQGANMALPIWADFMKSVLADRKYAKMRKSQFKELPDIATITLDCEPYIAPDTNSLWETLFGPKKPDSVRLQEKLERQKQKEERKKDKGRRKDTDDGFWNIFKKKK